MSTDMEKGQKKYLRFIKKAKKDGKTHAEANDLWNKEKESKKKPDGAPVATKPKSKPKKRQSGFARPKTLWDKLHAKQNRQRANLDTIKRVH